jgi:hypothetical protein
MVSVGCLLVWFLRNFTPVGRRLGTVDLIRLGPSQYHNSFVDEIKCVEKIRWPWSAKQFKRLILFVPITVGLIGGLLGGLRAGLLSGLIAGLFVSSGMLPTGGLTIVEIALRSFPNEGIKRSMQNGLLSGLFGFLSGLLYSGESLGSMLSLSSGLAFGVLAGLYYGGKAGLHHFALRLVLWHNNFAPFNYVGFLDYAAARIFLRKVGGGYVFVHRMLLEYFAAMHKTSEEQPNRNTHG